MDFSGKEGLLILNFLVLLASANLFAQVNPERDLSGHFASYPTLASFSCADAPAGVLFCDDFESTASLSDRYFEASSTNFLPTDGVGRAGSRGLRAVFDAGTVSAGSIKKSFGRTPSSYIGNHAVNPTQDYDEIYWRIDVRTQPGWQGGGGNKLARATTLAASNCKCISTTMDIGL